MIRRAQFDLIPFPFLKIIRHLDVSYYINKIVTTISHVFPLFMQVVYNRVARGMLHDDRITFAVLFARIRLKGRK